ncbi:MAG: histidinol-phosphate transaminase [Spirochaetota bacterium]
MKKIEDYFVPWLKGVKMYISSHIELAWQNKKLIRMMSNENPLPPSPKVLEAINSYGKIGNRYPDQGLVVRSKIAQINGLDGPENVLIGNGSSEVYDMIWRSFVQPGEEIIQHTPCFGIYKLRCTVVGGKLVSVPMIYDKDGFHFDPDGIIKAITPKTKIVVVANPNNPTGNFMEPEGFVKIAETGIPFVVDEAYVEYAGLGKSQVGLTKEYPNVIITRTLSKAYGLAGIRFGYALGAKEVIAQIAATLIPWNVGTIAMWAALAALEDEDALRERVKFNNSQIKFFEDELKDVSGLKVFHSYGNYILFDGKESGKKGDDMVAFALKKGLIFRQQEPVYGNDGFFRITIGTRDENKKAVEAIREFYTA